MAAGGKVFKGVGYGAVPTVGDVGPVEAVEHDEAAGVVVQGGCDIVAEAGPPTGKIIKSGECGAEGGNVKYELDENGLLVISGTGKMQLSPVTFIFTFLRMS